MSLQIKIHDECIPILMKVPPAIASSDLSYDVIEIWKKGFCLVPLWCPLERKATLDDLGH